MLLRGFLEMETAFPPCHPGQMEWMRASAELTDDISPVFPYLNAIMKGTVYDADRQTLNFKLGGRGVTLRARRVFVTRLENEEDAWEVLDRLKTLINRTYAKRGQIEPSTKSRGKLTALDVYRLLPQTNCRECGEATCLAFAIQLITELVRLERCTPLFSDAFSANRERLLTMLEEAGYEVPSF